jgi:predicted nucleotidyltransferase
MKRFEKIKGILAMHGDELRERFKVKELGVFGEQAI